MDTDESIILDGSTEGSLQNINEGDSDFAAISLDADGEVLWRYQASNVENGCSRVIHDT